MKKSGIYLFLSNVLDISTAKYKKNTLKYVVCHDNSRHLLKYLLGICLCSMLISRGHFVTCTIAAVKVKLIPDFYT